MAHVAFDTLKFVNKLKVAGWTEPAAIAFSEIQNETLVEAMDNTLATKNDIYALKDDIRALKTDFDQKFVYLDNKIETVETKFELKLERTIAPLRTNIKILNWMFSILISGVAALVLKAYF